MEESTKRRSASPPADDGKQQQQQQARDRSKSPAQQQTEPLAGELTRGSPSPEAAGGAEASRKTETEEGSSSPPAATGDRSRPSSPPTAQPTSPAPKETGSDERRRSTDEQESHSSTAGDQGTEERLLSDAANEPTLAGTPEKEEGEEQEQQQEQLEPAKKPAPSSSDEEEKEVPPVVVASPPKSPSPAPEPEVVTKTTSPNPTEMAAADESAATEAVAMVTPVATEASEGEQKAAAVVIDEPRRSPPVAAVAAAAEVAAVPEQSRRSRKDRSHSSSSSGSSDSSSDSTSASGHHSSDGVVGGSLPKKVKLEPVENQQQAEQDKQADVEMHDDGSVQKLLEGNNCATPAGGGTSILKARIEQRTAERPAAVETSAKPASQTPSREQSLRSSLNSDGSVSPRQTAGAEVEPEVAVTATTPTMEKVGQSGTPSVAPRLPSRSPGASSRACSPSLASSSAQSTPTKDNADPADRGGAGGGEGGPGDGSSPAVQPALKVMKVAPVGMVGLEKPDSARLTADLQSCRRQLAEVRSKYDVTRKELHATKRKLKRMSVRLNGMAVSSSATSAASGANSPHVAGVGAGTAAPSEEDRNRKWREPMILSAMKIKAAMGIQAYKSLIKDGELLLPSLRTITRYLESLRKAGGGNGLAVAAIAAAGGAGGGAVPEGAGAAKSTNAAIDVDDEDEGDDEEDDVVLATAEVADHQQQQQQQQGHTRRKLAKAGADGVRRTVDHNRNEQQHQQRHGNGGAAMRNSSGRFLPLHHHAPEVHLQDIKTEQDPVSFTASPDINYYQHNANDDEDDDEDGYQDPTSLLEQSRYDGDGGVRLNGDDTGYHHQQYAAHQANQQQTLTQAQIEFLKSMVGFRKKWTPYELRTCNEIRLIIGSREYDSLRKNDGMPLPSVKTLRKYRNTEQAPVDLPDEVDLMGRKRKHHEMLAEEGVGVGGGGPAAVGQHKAAEAYGEGRLFPYGNAVAKVMKAEQDSEDGHFDVGVLTKAQISFLKTLSLNTKGFSDYELQRSLELKNELGSKNYETLRKQEFLNIPTLVMLTRYEQDNGLEDLSRMAGAAIAVDDDEHDGRGGDGVSAELMDNDVRHTVEEEDRLQHSRQQQQLEEEQAREEQQQQQQLELYNRLTQADLTRHPLFDSIAGDTSPVDGADPTATAAAIAAAMAAAAVSMHQSLDLNGGTGDDSSLGIFENHSIFDKDSPTFDMSKLSPAHVEFLNTLPENPKRWTQEMINSALDIKNEIGTRDYEILRRQGIPLPAARTLRRHKDIRNKADRAMSEPGEILPGSGATAGVVGSG